MSHAFGIGAEQGARDAVVELQSSINAAHACFQALAAQGNIAWRVFVLQQGRCWGVFGGDAIAGDIFKNRLGHVAAAYDARLQETETEPGGGQFDFKGVQIHPFVAAYGGVATCWHSRKVVDPD